MGIAMQGCAVKKVAGFPQAATLHRMIFLRGIESLIIGRRTSRRPF